MTADTCITGRRGVITRRPYRSASEATATPVSVTPSRAALPQADRLVDFVDERLEQLAHDAKRIVAFELEPARSQHHQPALVRVRCQRAQKRRLAGSRRALDHREPALTGSDGCQQSRDARQLALALQQRRCGPHC